MKTYNHMIDIAFCVEGEWENFEQIPHDVLINALEKRVDYLKHNPVEAAEAFGFCDSYEVGDV